MMWRELLCAALLAIAESAWASNEVLVEKAWLRESVPGQTSASLQLNLTAIKPARLVGVSSPWAEAVEIQRLSLGQGKVTARAVPDLNLPRNQAVTFGEHNISLMMVGLKRPLNVGDSVPVKLTVEFPDKRTHVVEVEAEVRRLQLSYKHYSGQEVHDHR